MNQMTIFEAIDPPKNVGIRYRWHIVKRYEDLDQHIHERLLTIENSYRDMDEAQQEAFRQAYKDALDGARVVVGFHAKELVRTVFEGLRDTFKKMRRNSEWTNHGQ